MQKRVVGPEGLLTEIARQIEPTPSQRSGASRSHAYLRELLDTGEMANRIVRSYLSGSYARGTAIRPLEDVDIIFIVDPSQWRLPILSSLPKPANVLTTFERAIRCRYDSSSLRTQRRSIRVQLNHLDIDVVPAVVKSESAGTLRIPDAERGEWIVTAPLVHSSLATEVNGRCGGRFKRLVKLLKYWNSGLPETANLKSFAVETIAVRIFRKTGFTRLEDGLVAFFEFLARFSSYFYSGDTYGMSNSWLGGLAVPDVARTGSNTTANVDGDRRKSFFEHATMAKSLLMGASDDADRMDAIKRIFRRG
jgi:hypothetical protein